MKKYELVNNSVMGLIGKEKRRELYQIRALRDFGNVKKGELGGYIESEENLSHDGLCWVSDQAMVMDKAIVSDDAFVRRFAKVSGCARIYDCADITGWAIIEGHSEISKHAHVLGNAHVFGNAKISEYASVDGHSVVMDNAIVRGSAYISGNSKIQCNADVTGTVRIIGDALIKSTSDYFTAVGVGLKSQHIMSFFRLSDGNIGVTYGSFRGTLDEFRDYVEAHATIYTDYYLAIIDSAEFHFRKD